MITTISRSLETEIYAHPLNNLQCYTFVTYVSISSYRERNISSLFLSHWESFSMQHRQLVSEQHMCVQSSSRLCSRLASCFCDLRHFHWFAYERVRHLSIHSYHWVNKWFLPTNAALDIGRKCRKGIKLSVASRSQERKEEVRIF